jgi:hypothetical protein
VSHPRSVARQEYVDGDRDAIRAHGRPAAFEERAPDALRVRRDGSWAYAAT